MDREAEAQESRNLTPASRQIDDARDLDCVYRTLHEDRNAFREIVERYTPLFYSLAVKMVALRSREEVEETLQEIFLKIYAAIESFDSSRRFYSWAYTIAVNYLRSQRRNRIKDTHLSYEDEIGLPGSQTGYRSPEDEAEDRQTQKMVEQGLGSIKKRYRDVFILRELEGLSVTETAEVLGIPEGTVKTFLFRGKKALRAWLKERQWYP